MTDEITDWEVISRHEYKYRFWEMVFGVLAGGPLTDNTLKFKLRQTGTGYIKTITVNDERELPQRIAKGAFDYERIVSQDEQELILTGIRSGAEARELAFDHIEHVFRHRLEEGNIDPRELFTNIQDVLRLAGDEAVREFGQRCLPLMDQYKRNG